MNMSVSTLCCWRLALSTVLLAPQHEQLDKHEQLDNRNVKGRRRELALRHAYCVCKKQQLHLLTSGNVQE